MPTLLASLIFAAAALAATGAIIATWTRYRDVALGHVAALRAVDEARDFRVRILGQGRQPVLAGHPGVRRLPHRAAAARRFATMPARAAA